MKPEELKKQLAKVQATVRVLHEELAGTNRGLMALTMELEQRVDERTAELRTAHTELKKTNSELMQLALELEDRVTQRTAELSQANETLRAEIAERQRAEDEIQRLNDELEQRVIQRTAQLNAANQELEAFSYSVSHDLRAPLRGIDGWSLALLEDCADRLDEQGRNYLNRVRSETQRMGQLIDDLLQLSRVTRREMRASPVDLSALAQTIAANLQQSHPDRQVEFLIQPGLQTNGDAGLLEVALNNLLENAWKFTGKCPAARIEFGRMEREATSVFFVRDNGAGFDMTFAQRLFAPFQRLHRSSEFPGTGIGLATVQRILNRHGGRIWAESQVGKGATLFFILPDHAPQ